MGFAKLLFSRSRLFSEEKRSRRASAPAPPTMPAAPTPTRRSSRLATPEKGRQGGRSPSPPPSMQRGAATPSTAAPVARLKLARSLLLSTPAAPARHVEYEFLGPRLGPALLILGLPAVCYALIAACNGANGCVGGAGDLVSRARAGGPWPGLPRPLFTWPAFWAVPAWFAFQAGLHALLPGPAALGAPLRDGRRLAYKLTGLANLGVTLLVVALVGFSPSSAAAAQAGRPPPRLPPWLPFGPARGGGGRTPLRLAWAHDNVVPLLTAACAWSGLLSAGLFAASFRGRAGPAASKPLLALGGDTPSHLYNFFMGRELNPRGGLGLPPGFFGGLAARVACFDWKEFCELYPGLIGWVVLDLAACASALSTSSTIPPPLAMVTAFHTLYVADALAHERAILTTMDITTDGFGFMLAFGDLAWVPFIYSLPARYAADFPAPLSRVASMGIYALFGIGYAIFRGSNSQKDAFRSDPANPKLAHLKTITTATGRRLLVSGWWGSARHINYLGDWLLGLAWCLPCGTGSCVPYFYALYFGVLLGELEEEEEEEKREARGGCCWKGFDGVGARGPRKTRTHSHTLSLLLSLISIIPLHSPPRPPGWRSMRPQVRQGLGPVLRARPLAPGACCVLMIF